jgi:hypothetical protein
MFTIPLSLRKTVMTVAVGALATAGLLAASPRAAHADDGPPVQIFPVSNIFLYLDVSGGSKGDGAPVILYSQSGDNQLWQFRPLNGSTEIVNKHSGKCLTTDGVAGHQLYQWYCAGTPGQLWVSTVVAGAFEPGTIRNSASGLMVDVSGGSVSQGAAIIGWYYTGGNNQRFWFHQS